MKINKIICSFRKHERFIYLKINNDLNGTRKLQQMYKCRISVIFIKEVDIYYLKLSKWLLFSLFKVVLEVFLRDMKLLIFRRKIVIITMSVVFSLDAKFWQNKSHYCPCEDKSCPYCVFGEIFSKHYQQMVKSEQANSR